MQFHQTWTIGELHVVPGNHATSEICRRIAEFDAGTGKLILFPEFRSSKDEPWTGEVQNTVVGLFSMQGSIMATGQVSNVEWAQKLANEPHRAKQELRRLVELISTDHESIREWVTEALENCGPPDDEDLPWLSEQLMAAGSDNAYWCSTLLGRAGDKARAYQRLVFRVLESKTMESHAKARAIWALGRMGPLESEIRDLLTQFARSTESPRLSDLAHQSLIATETNRR